MPVPEIPVAPILDKFQILGIADKKRVNFKFIQVDLMPSQLIVKTQGTAGYDPEYISCPTAKAPRAVARDGSPPPLPPIVPRPALRFRSACPFERSHTPYIGRSPIPMDG